MVINKTMTFLFYFLTRKTNAIMGYFPIFKFKGDFYFERIKRNSRNERG